MREFFKGWRRKLGCATLGLACLFMVGWVRSINGVALRIDRVQLPFSEFDKNEIASFRRGLLWERVSLVHKREEPRVLPGTEVAIFKEYAEILVDYHLPHLAGVIKPMELRFEWRWEHFGFDAGELRNESALGTVRAIFWIILIGPSFSR